jgi:hypothetical protein
MWEYLEVFSIKIIKWMPYVFQKELIIKLEVEIASSLAMTI